MTTARIHLFITAALFTVIVETAVIFFLLRYVFEDKKTPTSRIIFAGIFASFATIPYVWFVFPVLINWSATVGLISSETFAFVVEAIFYRIVLNISLSRAITISFIANLASFLLGRLLRGAGIWIYW